jgi:hypothetical protein
MIVKSVISVIMIGMSVNASAMGGSALNAIINVTKIGISAPSVIMIGIMTVATLVTLVTVD